MSEKREVVVYGMSDDLIEIDGAIGGEYPAPDDAMTYLAFSDGTVLSIIYTLEGLWRVNRLISGSAAYTKTEATEPEEDYSDKVTLTGNDLWWFVVGTDLRRITKAPTP